MTSEKNNESRLPPESLPWGRDTDESIQQLRQEINQIKQAYVNSANSTQSTLNTGIRGTQEAISLIPIAVANNVTNSGLGLSAVAWTTVASFQLDVPDGKKTAVVTANGAASFADTGTGGSAILYAVIYIDGTPSVVFSAAKDQASSASVKNVCYPSFGRTLTKLYSPSVGAAARVLVRMDVYPTDPAAFATQTNNFATLTATGVFS